MERVSGLFIFFILFFNTTGGRQRVADEVKTEERTTVKRIVQSENQSWIYNNVLKCPFWTRRKSKGNYRDWVVESWTFFSELGQDDFVESLRDKNNRSFKGSGLRRSIYADSSDRTSPLPLRNHACGLHQERGGARRAAEGRSERWGNFFFFSPCFLLFFFFFQDIHHSLREMSTAAPFAFSFAQGTFPAGCKALCCAMARVSSPWARPATSTGSTAWPSWTASPLKMVRPCTFLIGIAPFWTSLLRRLWLSVVAVLKKGNHSKLLLFIYSLFIFATGEVSHRSKFLRSDTYKANMAANRIVVSEMGTMAYPDPSKNFIVK